MKLLLKLTYILFMMLPFGLGIFYSIGYSFGLIGALSEGFTLDNWVSLFKESEAIVSILYTFTLMLVSISLVLILSLLMSWNLRIGGLNAARLSRAFLLPLVFAPIVAAFSWYYLLSPTGIVSRLLFHMKLVGEGEFPRLVNDPWGFGIIIVHVFLVFPVFTLLFSEIARKENLKELFFISLSLGGSGKFFFRKVYLPMMIKSGLPLLLLYGVFFMGTYEVPLLLGVSSPRVITLFITEKLTRFNLSVIPQGYAMSVLYGLLVLIAVTIGIRKRKFQVL